MKQNRVPVELISPALSLIGSLISLCAAIFGEKRTKAGVLSATLGAIGSSLWMARAYYAYQQEMLEESSDVAADAAVA